LPKVFKKNISLKFYLNILFFVYLEFSDQMHFEASKYMMNDHDDNSDFPDHFTYYPYDKVKTNERLDYIFQRLFKEKYLDCKFVLFF